MAPHDPPLHRDNDDPDLPLIEAVRSGNTAAFEELVKRYDRRLFRIALNIVQNIEDAEDVVQEALLKAFRKLELFHGKSKFSTWLTRIVMNQALMKIRCARKTFVSIDDNSHEGEERPPLEIVDWAPNPEMAYSNSELRKILELSLRQLGEAHRTVFILRDIEGLSIHEVAETLDLTAEAVKTRTMRARLRLREELSRHFKHLGRSSEKVAQPSNTSVCGDASLVPLASRLSAPTQEPALVEGLCSI